MTIQPIRQNAPPFVKVPTPELETKMAGLNMKIKMANEGLAALVEKTTADMNDWAGRAGECGSFNCIIEAGTNTTISPAASAASVMTPTSPLPHS